MGREDEPSFVEEWTTEKDVEHGSEIEDEDPYSGRTIPVIYCCIIVLVIIMTILLASLLNIDINVHFGKAGTSRETKVDSHITVVPMTTLCHVVCPPVCPPVVCPPMANNTGTDEKITGVSSTRGSTLTSTTPAATTTTTATTAPTTTVTSATSTLGIPIPPGKPRRNFTLICVFEYLITRPRWDPADQCTDYVYIRFMTYNTTATSSAQGVMFTRKLRIRKYYKDDSDQYWNYIDNTDNRIPVYQRKYPHAGWYLGMWGTTLIRLANFRITYIEVKNGLRKALYGSPSLNLSDYQGFAVINSYVRDTRHLQRKEYISIFDPNETPALLPAGWMLIHTVAVWPTSYALPEIVQWLLTGAHIAGLSTSNTTEDPYELQEHHTRYNWVSAPNPLNSPKHGVNGMLDNLKTFPKWKKFLNRTHLCFSVSTAINYYDTGQVDPLDWEDPLLSYKPFLVQRYTRFRFMSRKQFNIYSVDGMDYEFHQPTQSHLWVERIVHKQRNINFLHRMFAYDDANTIGMKMEKLLDAYPDDKCVVFDELGDESFEDDFTYKNHTVNFDQFAMLKAVASAMVKRYGPAFEAKYYT